MTMTMTLTKQTDALIKKYGQLLIDGTISDFDLLALLNAQNPKTMLFKNSEPYSAFAQRTETNYSGTDVVKAFVIRIGAQLSPEKLHALVFRMITNEPSQYLENQFLRQDTSLTKHFWAYECSIILKEGDKLSENPFIKKYREHETIKDYFGDFESSFLVIMSPLIDKYRNNEHPPVYPPREIIQIEENNEKSNTLKYQRLLKLCTDYKKHLIKSEPIVLLGHSSTSSLLSDTNENSLKNHSVAQKKYDIVCEIYTILITNSLGFDEKSKEIEKVLTPANQDTLKTHRSGALFLENILHVLTLGLYSKATKGTFCFWKTHGECFDENVAKVMQPR